MLRPARPFALLPVACLIFSAAVFAQSPSSTSDRSTQPTPAQQTPAATPQNPASLPPQTAQHTAAALVGATAEVLIGPLTTGDTSAIEDLRKFTIRALGVVDANS